MNHSPSRLTHDRWLPRLTHDHWLLLVLLAALPLYGSQLNVPLLEPEEIRQAEVARQMLVTGQLIVPVLHGQPYLDKPPLLYWLLIGSYQLLGVGDVACRVVVGLCAWLTLVVVGVWLRCVPGTRGLAVWAVVVLALLPEFCYRARMLTMNSPLTLWTTAALACGHLAGLAHSQQRLHECWRWCGLAGGCLGLGLLTKGPVAAVLVALPLAVCVRLGWRGWLILAATALAIAAPWYAAVAYREPDFARYFFLFHHVQRFAAPFDHAKPWWFFLPWLALGTLPWTIAAALGLGWWHAGRTAPAGCMDAAGGTDATRCTDAAGCTDATRSSASGQLWLLTGLAAGWTVLFFSIAGSKRPGYILPALPPLAVLLAASVCRLAGRRPLLTQSLVVGMAALLVFAVNLWLPAYHDRFALRQAVRSGLAGAIHPPGGAGGVTVPIYSYPRRWDSISFYLQRQDVQAFTPAQVPELLTQLRQVDTAAIAVKTDALAELLAQFPADLHFELRWQTGWLTTGIVRSTGTGHAPSTGTGHAPSTGTGHAAQHPPEPGQALAQGRGVPGRQ
jgi:4-amino-4-deoxy-L-arabinose transferase-like glycosyltransferase